MRFHITTSFTILKEMQLAELENYRKCDQNGPKRGQNGPPNGPKNDPGIFLWVLKGNWALKRESHERAVCRRVSSAACAQH